MVAMVAFCKQRFKHEKSTNENSKNSKFPAYSKKAELNANFTFDYEVPINLLSSFYIS